MEHRENLLVLGFFTILMILTGLFYFGVFKVQEFTDDFSSDQLGSKWRISVLNNGEGYSFNISNGKLILYRDEHANIRFYPLTIDGDYNIFKAEGLRVFPYHLGFEMFPSISDYWGIVNKVELFTVVFENGKNLSIHGYFNLGCSKMSNYKLCSGDISLSYKYDGSFKDLVETFTYMIIDNNNVIVKYPEIIFDITIYLNGSITIYYNGSFIKVNEQQELVNDYRSGVITIGEGMFIRDFYLGGVNYGYSYTYIEDNNGYIPVGTSIQYNDYFLAINTLYDNVHLYYGEPDYGESGGESGGGGESSEPISLNLEINNLVLFALGFMIILVLFTPRKKKSIYMSIDY